MTRLVLASLNAHKLDEVRQILEGTGVEVLDLRSFPELGEPPEDGAADHCSVHCWRVSTRRSMLGVAEITRASPESSGAAGASAAVEDPSHDSGVT